MERFKEILIVGCNSGEIPDGFDVFALNFELPMEEADHSNPPEWIPLLPAGVNITGHDGRSWINDTPEGIIDWFNNEPGDLPVDWEHSTEIKAPKGEEAPAAGWGKEMKLENDRLMGRIEWTRRGRESIINREYRYISPVLIYEKATRRIAGIRSVGLTNKPNLFLNALNSQQFSGKEKHMDFKELLKLLGLSENATQEEAMNAVKKLQGDLTTANNSLESVKNDLALALNQAANPPLDKFVPRADYDAAISRAQNAEKTIADGKKEELETAINAEVDAAIKAGKIAPASKDYYLSSCRQEGGLDRFREFIKSAPEIIKDTDLDKREIGEGLALNAEQKKVSDMLGVSEEDLKKYGGMGRSA